MGEEKYLDCLRLHDVVRSGRFVASTGLKNRFIFVGVGLFMKREPRSDLVQPGSPDCWKKEMKNIALI